MSLLTLCSFSHNDCLKLRLTDSYAIHRTVCGLFRFEDEPRILHADMGFQNGIRRILVLSENPPGSWEYGKAETKAIPRKFLECESYDFKVIVNPVRQNAKTRKLEIPPGKSGSGIRAWFEGKAGTWGFEARASQADFWIDRFRKPSGTVTLAKARIAGSLLVRNRDLFLKSFAGGLGRGKAFGCGLLQLRPVR